MNVDSQDCHGHHLSGERATHPIRPPSDAFNRSFQGDAFCVWQQSLRYACDTRRRGGDFLFTRKPSMPSISFATCDLCDANEDDTGGAFRVLPPVLPNFGPVRPFGGPVHTLRCLEDNSLVREAANSPGQGRVLVIDGGGSLRRALVGGNLAVAAAQNGWAGIVVDGCVRDVAELRTCGIPIRALALMPLRTAKRGDGQAGGPVQIQGVWVRPGDWLYADEDGIVVADRALI
jgi:regulator of ribonuclease activity A